MKKLKLIKYDESFMYVTDVDGEMYGTLPELQTMLEIIIEGMKKKGISDGDIMVAVNCGLKGEEWVLEQLEKRMREAFKILFEEEKPKKKATKKEGKKDVRTR